MNNWVRRIRGAVVMGVTWALAWALIGGLIMEGVVDPHGKIVDMWPQTLAIPGFLGGVVFSIVLSIAAGRRRFDELSLPRFAALGAVAGVLLGAFAISTGAAGALQPLWLRAVVIFGPMTLLSTLSATGSLAIARTAERRALPRAGSEDAG